eukprot:701552-Hanusia_phi.AAC.1
MSVTPSSLHPSPSPRTCTGGKTGHGRWWEDEGGGMWQWWSGAGRSGRAVVLRAQHRQAGAARRIPAARTKRSRRSTDGLAARGLQQAGESSECPELRGWVE